VKALAILAAALVAAVLIYDSAVILRALARGRDLAAASEPLSQTPSPARRSLLIVGDSTAVGTGAGEAGNSIAGRLARRFPDLHIDNLAEDGAVYSELPEQLEQAPRQSYDLVLVQAGGNDVLKFSSRKALAADIQRVFESAAALGERVAVLATGDVGTAPAIPWPLGGLFTARSRMLRDLVAERAAQRPAVHFVDLLADADSPGPFQREPERYYAGDGLHPSGAGYGLWYQKLSENLPLEYWLSGEQTGPRSLPRADQAPL